RSSAGPLRIYWSRARMPADSLEAALWRHLDTNGDGKLSQAELKAAPRVLSLLDRDDDEILTPAELVGNNIFLQPPPTYPGKFHGLAAGGMPFFSFHPGGEVAPLREAFLSRYGQKQAERWLEAPPDLELIVPLDNLEENIRHVRRSSEVRLET